MIFVRSLVVWLVFILLESLNGAVRIFWLVPSLGDSRAQQIAFVTGSVLVLTVATLFSRWLQASQVSQLLSVGMLWMVLTLAFEISLGRVIFGYSWEQIAVKFNVLNGGLMPFELVLLTLAPLIAAKIRGTLTNLKTSADEQSARKEHYDYENTNDFG
jgi:hypothetical protein